METRSRPIGVTILAVIAAFLAIIAIVRTLSWLGLFPWIGPGPAIRTFNLWYALLYGLLAWVYIWLIQMLWQVNPSAWYFLVIITIFNLIVDFVTVVTSNLPTADITTLSLILNGLILIYCVLPGTRRAFGIEQTGG